MLQKAGVSMEVCRMTRDIVHACRACRQWQRPSSNNMPTLRLSLSFSECVQVDILFVGDLTIAHLIDECLRRSGGGVSKNNGPAYVVR
eukprot:5785636-Pyramimonas_sp.AAC.1